jgi:hypothetical protein
MPARTNAGTAPLWQIDRAGEALLSRSPLRRSILLDRRSRGSWILLASIAARGMTQALDGQVVAWIHLVALGWFSMAALGILIHVIPSFTDLTWRHEDVARRSLGAFGAGIALFVTAWLALHGALVAGALLSAGAFATYPAAASATLWQGRRAAPTERAISRALALTLWTFFTVAVIGVLMAFATTGAARRHC